MSEHAYLYATFQNSNFCDVPRGGKKIRAREYPRIKSVMGTGRVAKRVPADIINGYLATRYFMDTDTDMMIPVPAGIRTH